MKGQKVGNIVDSATLVWPNSAAMQTLQNLIRPKNTLLIAEVAPEDLLWPAALINQQARLRHSHAFIVPLSIFNFIISIILGFIVGPMQLILLVATTYGYNWVTTIYFSSALKYVLLASGLVAILNIIMIVLAWRAQPERTRFIATLAASSALEIALIWIFAVWQNLQPHHLSLILLAGSISGLLVSLLVHKQYASTHTNGLAMKLFLSLLIVINIIELSGGLIYFAEASAHPDSAELQQIAAEQAQAKLPGVSDALSNSIFTLCGGRYQIIYLTDAGDSGLFECTQNGEVYSVMEIPSQSPKTIDSAATYLGTTKNPDISRAFPSAYYLYRSIPEALSEDELAMLVLGNTEREVVDNITQPLLEYWQAHNQHNLYLNIFYTRNISSITSTRDFILMAALDTMALVDKLPHGNTIKGYANGEITNYLFQPDVELKALHELSARPDLTSADSLDALTFRKHISIHLSANEALDAESLRTKLENSFTGGAQN